MSRKSLQRFNLETPLFWKRVSASFFDYFVIVAWIAVVTLVGLLVSRLLGGYPDVLGLLGPVGAQLVFFVVLTLPVGMYLCMTESGSRRATIGKLKMGLWVSSASGALPSRKSIVVRTAVKLLPWELAHAFIWQMQYVFYISGVEAEVPIWILVGLGASNLLAIMYVAFIVLRSDGRGPHDLVARTRVVVR